MSVLLELKRADCGYAGRAIVEDVNFDVSEGEVLCILGKNGAGKTTLFKSMLGLISLIGGHLLIEGEDTKTWTRQQLARKVGYVPQAVNPPFAYSVFDSIVMGRVSHMGMFSAPTKEDESIAYQVIEQLDIEELLGKRMTLLSGGEKQLVVIARALVQQPKILIMDEPTAALDFGNQQMVLEQVHKLSQSGLAIIMASHFPDHAFLYAHKCLLIRNGGIYAYGPSAQVITERSLSDLYGIEARIYDTHLFSPNTGLEIKTCIPIGTIKEKSGD